MPSPSSQTASPPANMRNGLPTRTMIEVACVLLLTHVTVLANFGNQSVGAVLSDVVQLLLGLLCVLTCLQAFRRSGNVARYFCRWLLASFLMWMAAQAVGTYIDVTPNHSVDFIADLLFFCPHFPLAFLLSLHPP